MQRFASPCNNQLTGGLIAKSARWNWQKVKGREVAFSYIRYENFLISYIE